MTGERRAGILTELFRRVDTNVGTAELCQVTIDITDTTGAGVILMLGDGTQISAGTSDEVSAKIEELQFALGEGPSIDAFQQARPVLEPDLADPVIARWVGFTAPVVNAGARAVFSFPVQVGAARFGVLSLYRNAPGPLSREQHADALAMADVTAEAVLAMQANAPPGALAAELEAGAHKQSVIHQATGMISVQLEVSVAEALIRLRAHAFANDRRLVDVAKQVVDRRLRFGEHGIPNDKAS